MNLFRPQLPYVFRPARYSRAFKPILHWLTAAYLKHKFNVRQLNVHGGEKVGELVQQQHSVLVTPNHADHADPGLLVQAGRRHGVIFNFMAAREGFERGRVNRFILQHSGAFSVDREGADIAAIKNAIQILHDCQHPLVIFPEGEIYHHHEALDELNEGVATILLRAAHRLPPEKKSYVVPTAIRLSHGASVSTTFSERLDRLEKRITWKPRTRHEPVDRIYRLGAALLSIKEEEFIGQAQTGDMIKRIQGLQQHLIGQIETAHNVTNSSGKVPLRIKALRQIIRKELNHPQQPLTDARREVLYDELDRVYVAHQFYSYPGQYLSQNPSIDRIAETLLKLEEDVLELENYPAPRSADVIFGEPIEVKLWLASLGLDAKSGVQPMTELLRTQIEKTLAAPTGTRPEPSTTSSSSP